MSTWHWAQWVFAALLALYLIGAIVGDGEPCEGKLDMRDAIITVAGIVWLLWCGGFWG